MSEDRNARRRARAAVKRKTDSRIRVGDRVRILEPKVFLRCGYPMGRVEALHEIMTNHAGDLELFLNKLGIPMRHGERSQDRLLHELAYAYQRAHGFGGYKRTIYTEDRPEIVGRECVVLKRKTVMTGEYFPPSRGGWDYDDYENGGIDNAQTHVVFKVTEVHNHWQPMDDYWIEARYLEKVVSPIAANQSELIPF